MPDHFVFHRGLQQFIKNRIVRKSMGQYSGLIPEKRRAVQTPENIVNPDGSCVFGTFDREFQKMDFVRLKRPTEAPQALNRIKLTLWEATEVHFDEGVLLLAVCDMGLFGKVVHVFYDKRTKQMTAWEANLTHGSVTIAPNLIGGSVTQAETKNCSVRYTNRFDEGACEIAGFHQSKSGRIEYALELRRLSKPSVVSIPFGPNRPLYSQKDFFRASGKISLGGEVLASNERSVAIVDDHRGYYPRHAHYDWVTTMGVNETNGEKRYFAFNLTRNQSINQNDYNENLIWLENETSLLPPVTFTRNRPSGEFDGHAEWTVRDEHGMVDVRFLVDAQYAMILHTGLVNIDYFIAFGSLEGRVLDEDGNAYHLDGMMGLGEDKTLLL